MEYKEFLERLKVEQKLLQENFGDEYQFPIGKVGSRQIEGNRAGPMWGSLFVQIKGKIPIQIGRLLYSDEKDRSFNFSHTKIYGENWHFSAPQVMPKPDKFWEEFEQFSKHDIKENKIEKIIKIELTTNDLVYILKALRYSLNAGDIWSDTKEKIRITLPKIDKAYTKILS